MFLSLFCRSFRSRVRVRVNGGALQDSRLFSMHRRIIYLVYHKSILHLLTRSYIHLCDIYDLILSHEQNSIHLGVWLLYQDVERFLQ